MDTNTCLLLLSFDLPYEEAAQAAKEDADYIRAVHPEYENITWDIVSSLDREERDKTRCVARVFYELVSSKIDTVFCDVCSEADSQSLYSLLRELIRECGIRVIPISMLKGVTE